MDEEIIWFVISQQMQRSQINYLKKFNSYSSKAVAQQQQFNEHELPAVRSNNDHGYTNQFSLEWLKFVHRDVVKYRWCMPIKLMSKALLKVTTALTPPFTVYLKQSIVLQFFHESVPEFPTKEARLTWQGRNPHKFRNDRGRGPPQLCIVALSAIENLCSFASCFNKTEKQC